MMAVRSWILVAVLVVLVAGVVVAKKTVLAPVDNTPRPTEEKPRLEQLGKAVRAAQKGESSAFPDSAEPQTAASGIPKRTLTVAALASSLASGKPTLVDFGAGTCEQCKREAPVLDTAVEVYRGKANVVFINTDASPELAKQYGIKFIPTQIFFNKQGKEVTRHIGYHPPQAVVADFTKAGAPAMGVGGFGAKAAEAAAKSGAKAEAK